MRFAKSAFGWLFRIAAESAVVIGVSKALTAAASGTKGSMEKIFAMAVMSSVLAIAMVANLWFVGFSIRILGAFVLLWAINMALILQPSRRGYLVATMVTIGLAWLNLGLRAPNAAAGARYFFQATDKEAGNSIVSAKLRALRHQPCESVTAFKNDPVSGATVPTAGSAYVGGRFQCYDLSDRPLDSPGRDVDNEEIKPMTSETWDSIRKQITDDKAKVLAAVPAPTPIPAPPSTLPVEITRAIAGNTTTTLTPEPTPTHVSEPIPPPAPELPRELLVAVAKDIDLRDCSTRPGIYDVLGYADSTNRDVQVRIRVRGIDRMTRNCHGIIEALGYRADPIPFNEPERRVKRSRFFSRPALEYRLSPGTHRFLIN